MRQPPPRRPAAVTRRLASLAAVGLGLSLATCGGYRPPRDGGSQGPPPALSAGPNPDADPVAALPQDGPVRVYRGAFARNPAVLAFQREAPGLLARSVERLREELGLRFLDGRGPQVVLDDAQDLGPDGATDLRLLDGVRRPVLRVRAAAIASGEFRATEHLPALVARAGVLAASPERAPPEWLLDGVPAAFADLVVRRTAEAVFANDALALDARSRAELEPAFRVAALQRIGLGERVVARFLAVRMGGASDADALREVGVGGPDFLDAAAATEVDRTVEQVTEDPRCGALRRVRAAIAAADAAAAERARSALVGAEGGDPWIDAEVGVASAEISMLRGETGPAARTLDEVLGRPEHVIRLRRATGLRAAALAGDAAGVDAVTRFVREHPSDTAAGRLAALLHIGAEEAAEATSPDPAVRVQALARIGARHDSAAAPFVASCLEDGAPTVRAAAVQALGEVGRDADVATIARATRDTEPSVRAAALLALRSRDLAAAAVRAGEMSADPDPSVRKVAARIVETGEELKRLEAQRRATETPAVRPRPSDAPAAPPADPAPKPAADPAKDPPKKPVAPPPPPAAIPKR